MIVEWKRDLLSEPEAVMPAVEQKKPVRSVAAAQWEADQARLQAKTGLERPTRPVPPALPAEGCPAMPLDPTSAPQAKERSSAPAAGSPAGAASPRENGASHSLVKSAAKGAPAAHTPVQRSGFDRLLAAARIAVPIAQKVLPLLEGNVAAALANVLLQRTAPPPADLRPIEKSIDNLRASHIELDERVADVRAEMRRTVDRADRLQEIVESLSSDHGALENEVAQLRLRVALLARVSLGLLALLLLGNIYLALHIFHVVP